MLIISTRNMRFKAAKNPNRFIDGVYGASPVGFE